MREVYIVDVKVNDNQPYQVDLPTSYADYGYGMVAKLFLRVDALYKREISIDYKLQEGLDPWHAGDTTTEVHQMFDAEIIDHNHINYIPVIVHALPKRLVMILTKKDYEDAGFKPPYSAADVQQTIFERLLRDLDVDFFFIYVKWPQN